MDYKKYFEIADKISDNAADFLIENFGNIKKQTHKSDTHFGIDDDLTVDNIYRSYLTKVTPEISLFTEEGSKHIENLTWVVDPIEGTSNYRVGNPFFATQICLLKNKKPVLSIVNAPLLKQKFVAIKNEGSYLNSNKYKIPNDVEIKNSILSIGKGTKLDHLVWVGNVMQSLMPRIRSVRMMGSTGLEMSYVSAGLLDAHINFGSQPYDFAPASLILTESGGIAVNREGEDWTMEDNFIITGNKNLVSDILKIIV